MIGYYYREAIEILRQEGFVGFSKSSIIFILRQLGFHTHRRFRFYTRKNQVQNCIKYDAPPDPYKTIKIRPSKIEYRVGRNRTLDTNERPLKTIKKKGIGRIKGGEWDRPQHWEHVNDQNKIKAVTQRFQKNKQWKETELYEKKLNKYKDDGRYKKFGYQNPEKYVKDIFSRYEQLYENIKQGYERGHNGTNTKQSGIQPVRSKLEVLVVIDRKGDIHFFEGQKRFAISRVLDLKIPAHVVCRHKQWQEKRDKVHKNRDLEDHNDLRDHPDLQDILD